jgi:small subunit ribosomal protein S4
MIKPGDEVAVRERSRKNPLILAAMEDVAGRGVPAWLSLNRESFAGQVLELPSREEIKVPIEEQLIVELYSK